MRIWLKLGILVLTLVVPWVISPPAAIAQLESSVHDFTTTGPQSDFQGAPWGNMCVTCHTVHHSTEAILLWNHTLSSQTLTFGTNATTWAGTQLPTNIGAWIGTTKYCLSCHDGSVAVGSLIHGSWTAGGSNLITDPEKIIAPGGSLSGNHPVAIPYPDIPGAIYNSITTMADPTRYITVPTGVKIYGNVSGTKGMECASCHEPHRDNTHGPLLRSGFGCTACHKM